MKSRIEEITKVQAVDEDVNGLLAARGDVVPADGEVGYNCGCLFADLVNGKLYVNQGDELGCEFKELATV